jgi:hypothetical protein
LPALPAIQVHAFVALERELRRRGPGSLVRAAERAAALIPDLDLAAEYPTEYLVFRVLGERTSLEGPVLKGEETRALLCTLVERLTEHAGLELDHALVRTSISQEELAARWNVSRKTLDRLRRQGLAAIRARHPKAHSVLRFPVAWVERFERAYPERLHKAGRFERMSPELEARIVRRAARYQRVLGCSLNQAALRIAQRLDKSHEGVRQILQRHVQRQRQHEQRVNDAIASGGGLTENGFEAGAKVMIRVGSPPMRAKERALMARAWAFGIPMRTLTRRTRRSPAAIRRAIAMARYAIVAEVAHASPAPTPVPATFALADAAEVILAPALVRDGLVTQWPSDLAELLALAHVRVVPHANEETARALAMRFLVHRAHATIAKVRAMHPSALDVDQAEADLLWASRLRATLARPYLTLTIETLEERLGAPLATLPPKSAVELVSRGLLAAVNAVDHFDPLGRGRLAAAVGISVDRAAMAWVKSRGADPMSPKRGRRAPDAVDSVGRATRMLVPGFATIDAALIIHGAAWTFELAPRLKAIASRVEPAVNRAMLMRRYGLAGHVAGKGASTGGTGPVSVREAGRLLGLSPLAAGRVAHSAYIAALALARAK